MDYDALKVTLNNLEDVASQVSGDFNKLSKGMTKDQLKDATDKLKKSGLLSEEQLQTARDFGIKI